MQNEDRAAIFVVCSRKEMVTTETYPALSLALYVAVAAIARSCAALSDVALKALRCVKTQSTLLPHRFDLSSSK